MTAARAPLAVDGEPVTRARAAAGVLLRRLTNEAVLAWAVAAFDVPLAAACALAAATEHLLAQLTVAPPPWRARGAALRLEWLLLGWPPGTLTTPLHHAGFEADARDARVWWLEVAPRPEAAP